MWITSKGELIVFDAMNSQSPILILLFRSLKLEPFQQTYPCKIMSYMGYPNINFFSLFDFLPTYGPKWPYLFPLSP